MVGTTADGLIWHERPNLRDPLFVAGFEGWNDAAEAASDAAAWLVRHGDATPVASIDPEFHMDFQARRPQIELLDGTTQRIRWPANEFFAIPMPAAHRDLLVLVGCEPNYRWPSFCRAVIEVIRDSRSTLACTLGALLADAPHTRPAPVTGTATDPALSRRHGLAPSTYEGPTGIVGVLHDALRSQEIPSVSLWVPVPHYAAQAPNPFATRELLGRLDAIGGFALPLHDLDRSVVEWRAHIDATVAADEDMLAYVQQLEARYDESDQGAGPSHPSIPSADVIGAEVERFLRDHRGEDTGEGTDSP